MNTGISAAIRRLIEQHIVADDPSPEPSWLDLQDMPRVQLPSFVTMSGLPMEPRPPLSPRFGHGRDRRALRRVWARNQPSARQAAGGPADRNEPH